MLIEGQRSTAVKGTKIFKNMSEKESQFGAAIVRRREKVTKYVNQHLRATERRKTKHVDILRLAQVYTLYVVRLCTAL